MNIPSDNSTHSLNYALKNFITSENQSEINYQGIIKDFPNIQKSALDEILYSLSLDLNKELFPPIESGEIVLTTRCNLACKYCFEKPMLIYSKDMDEEVANKSVEFLFDYSRDSEKLNIVLFGGEPLMNPEILKKIVLYAEMRSKELGKILSFSLTTNGTLLDPHWLDFFSNHGIKLLISIDGLENSHNKNRVFINGTGTFNLIRKNLKKLKEIQDYIGAKVTITPNNLKTLSNDFKGLYELGVDHFIVSHASNFTWQKEDIELYIHELKNTYEWYSGLNSDSIYLDIFEEEQDRKNFYGCQAGRNSLAISTNGELSPCSRILGYDNENLIFKLGDVYKGLTNIQNRKKLMLCQELEENCIKSGLDDYRGGCFAINLEDEGNVFAPSIQDHFITKRINDEIISMKKQDN